MPFEISFDMISYVGPSESASGGTVQKRSPFETEAAHHEGFLEGTRHCPKSFASVVLDGRAIFPQ